MSCPWPGDGDQSVISRGLNLFIIPILKAMNLGSLFLKSLLTGVITAEEMEWVTHHQPDFNRIEEATALKLGRLLDRGQIQIGCRI